MPHAGSSDAATGNLSRCDGLHKIFCSNLRCPLIQGSGFVTAFERQIVLRRFTRRVYQVGAAVALVVTVQAVLLPAIGAGSAWLWTAVPILGAAAVLLTIKSIPYDHVKFP